MRFEEEIHWAEGLFLQPHHMQRSQRVNSTRIRNERKFYLPYDFGLVDFEVDREALAGNRVVLKRFSAIMPNGEELSMPGNCLISPLDISEYLQNVHEKIVVYLALPRWSEFDANLSENGDGNSKYQFSCHDTMVFDENSGENEVPISRHRFNARLTTNLHDNNDLDIFPIMQLKPIYSSVAETKLEIDDDYIPPFVMVSNDCPLLAMCVELNVQLRNCKNKILHDLTERGFKIVNTSSNDVVSLLQIQTLGKYSGRLNSLLQANMTTPFVLYLELKSLLAELAVLQPARDIESVNEYNHLDCAEQFKELLMHIRALILAEGIISYIRLDFAPTATPHQMSLELKDEHLIVADEYYLAISCDNDVSKVVNSVEMGDNFKLVNPNSNNARIRGVKLVEMRYPPKFLPALQNVVWFRFVREESKRVWDSIRSERGILLDWADEVFPKLEATLYITVLSKGE